MLAYPLAIRHHCCYSYKKSSPGAKRVPIEESRDGEQRVEAEPGAEAVPGAEAGAEAKTEMDLLHAEANVIPALDLPRWE